MELTFEQAKAIKWKEALDNMGSMWMPSSFEVDKIYTQAAELMANSRAAKAWDEGQIDLKNRITKEAKESLTNEYSPTTQEIGKLMIEAIEQYPLSEYNPYLKP
jgi:hypothetical protein